MNRPRVVKGLKITWTAFWSVVAISLIVLWVRSYYCYDLFREPVSASRAIMIFSIKGHMIPTMVRRDLEGRNAIRGFHTIAKNVNVHFESEPSNVMGFGWSSAPRSQCVRLPHWFDLLESDIADPSPSRRCKPDASP